MSSAGDIRAGKAFVELGLKGLDKIRSGLRRLTGIVQRGLAQVAKIAAALTAAAAAAVATFAKMGDEIDKAMQRTGLGARELTQLKHAAEEADVSFKSLQNGLFRMQRLRPGKTFEEVADEVANAGDAGEQAAKAYEIFGREGKELLPLLKQGSREIRRQRMEAERLGIVMSDEDAKAAAELTDSLSAVWKQIKMVIFFIGRWINENIGLVDSLKMISEVLGDMLAFMREGEMENAWEIMWRSMLVTFLSVLDAMSKPFKDFIDGIVNTFRDVQEAIIRFGATIGGFFNEEFGREMSELADTFGEFESDIGRGISDALEKNLKRLRELSAEAEKLRDLGTTAGAGGGAGIAGFGGGTGTFDPSMVLRRNIALGADNPAKRTADATERTARATESIESIFKRGGMLPKYR